MQFSWLFDLISMFNGNTYNEDQIRMDELQKSSLNDLVITIERLPPNGIAILTYKA